MKTLKKTLSLTLVFALVFSLMSMAFAADTTTATKAPTLSDFTDADKLTYTEAADYLIAAGIVKGDTATTLNPTASFQRDQAAKLIAYASLGQVAADNLKASVAPFKDVDASNWAAGYIAYCQKQGFVSGYGDGNFGPTDKVTGYQMAKMLLCSIGYGVNGEFTGNGWELSVAPTALSYGIFTGNAAGASAVAATREEAFLYTFNTLSTLCNVSYNKTLGVYYVPGRSALTTNPQSVTYGLTNASGADIDTRYDTVGAIKFGITRQVTTDDFDNAAHEWILNKVAVTDTYANDSIKILGTITDGTTINAATTNTNAKYIAGKASTGVSYFYNGAEVSAFSESANYTVGTKVVHDNALYVTTKAHNGTAWAAGDFTEYSVKGATVKLMAGTGTYATKVAKVSVIEKTVAQLGSAPVTKTSGSVTTVTITDCGISNINVKNVSYPTDLAENDVVLYYQVGSHYYVEKATAISGSNLVGYVAGAKTVSYDVTDVSNYKVAQIAARVTIGTSNYYISELTGGNVVDKDGFVATVTTVTAGTPTSAAGNMANYLNQTGYTYYLDDNGYVCYFAAPDATASLTNTVFVSKIADNKNFDDTWTAILVDSTGAAIEAKVSKYNKVSAAEPAAGFCTSTKQTDGSYALVPITSSSSYLTSADPVITGTTSFTITAKKVNFLAKVSATVAASTTWAGVADSTATTGADVQKANSSTVFMYYNTDTKSYTVKTGISNALNFAAGGTVYVLRGTNGFATFVVATGADTTVPTTEFDQYFIVSLAQVGTDTNGLPTYTYYAYKNGTLGAAISYEPLTCGNLYYATVYAANGYIKTVSQDATYTTYATDVTAVTYNSGVLGVTGTNGNNFVINSNAKFYLCDATDLTNITYSTTTANAAKSYTYENGASVTLVQTSATDTSIGAVYICIK